MAEFEETILAWYESGERHFETAESLIDCGYHEMPCYHFRLSAEIFMKTLNLLYMENPDLQYFDKNPTHKFAPLQNGIESNVSEDRFEILRRSAGAFRVKYTHYKYVVSTQQASPQSPSSLFSKASIETHKNAAQSIMRTAKDCLSEELSP